MPNGFTSPGGFNQNMKAATFFGSPYTVFPYSNALYNPPSNRPKFAYAILSLGKSQASRISKFNYRNNIVSQLQKS